MLTAGVPMFGTAPTVVGSHSGPAFASLSRWHIAGIVTISLAGVRQATTYVSLYRLSSMDARLRFRRLLRLRRRLRRLLLEGSAGNRRPWRLGPRRRENLQLS